MALQAPDNREGHSGVVGEWPTCRRRIAELYPPLRHAWIAEEAFTKSVTHRKTVERKQRAIHPGFMIIWKHRIPFSLNNEHAFSFRQIDDGLRPGIELQEILFDAVAEDDAVFRHL
jgi:hypothetical protein